MRMPQDDLCIASWHAKIFEQFDSGVTDRINADLADTVLIADPNKGAHEVARFDGSASPGCEDKTTVSPGRTKVLEYKIPT